MPFPHEIDQPLHARSAIAEKVSRSRAILLAFVLVFMGLGLVQAMAFQNPLLLRDEVTITDFNAFRIAGELAAEGRAADTYDWRTMHAEQKRRTGDDSFMPWAYPPQFTGLLALLATLPLGMAYLIFMAPGVLLFWFTLHRIAGPYVPAALAVCFPALLVNLRCGQNGFYTAAFIGGFLLLARGAKASAGIPLGLMAIKPHLAVATAVLALLERRWAALCIAAGIAIASSALATAYLGTGIWQAFAAGARASTGFLWDELFMLHRMTSLYAMLARCGLPPAAAMAFHVLGAAAALILVAVMWWRKAPRDWLLAATAITSVLISPYSYDYDLPVVAIAAAFVWPDLLRRASGAELLGIAILAALSGANMLYHTVYGSDLSPLWEQYPPIPFSWLMLLGAVAMCAKILRRPILATEQQPRSAAAALPA